jgi:hypothetical protein
LLVVGVGEKGTLSKADESKASDPRKTIAFSKFLESGSSERFTSENGPISGQSLRHEQPKPFRAMLYPCVEKSFFSEKKRSQTGFPPGTNSLNLATNQPMTYDNVLQPIMSPMRCSHFHPASNNLS